MKVTVVGAGSTYTPELVEGFVTHAERLPIDELALLDVDGERLDVVSGVSQRILRRSGWAGRVVSTTERDAASYPVSVRRPATSLSASFPRSVTLAQLRFASIGMTSYRLDLHQQDSAHAGRTRKKRHRCARHRFSHLQRREVAPRLTDRASALSGCSRPPR